jgi:ArsR family transcriptional regulator
MKELENAGLISTTRKGQSFTCEINMDAIKAIQQFLR